MSKPTGKKILPINTDGQAADNVLPRVQGETRRISRLLIANRGEIACRIINTANKMGIETIAVYSQADRMTKHVAMADHAIMIGPAVAAESYLNISRIIEAALTLAADAIHPGYGFLSENAEFADACRQHGLIFIGPPAEAMLAMSSKSEAKTIMERAQVPLVPGFHGEDNSPETLLAIAGEIGYPVLLKAALGGGGKGMRIVCNADEMQEAVASAKREARSSFGDDLLLIEKYLLSPRHIEVQIFADQQGNTIYLSDRDCSLQRRHQKIVEEAPAPNLPESLRQAMGLAAVNAAKAIGYIGAGTVEFLLDGNGHFYFMEMNTRLQVEHPVTELITGQDLVEWQINIAEGQALPLGQQQIQPQGHAIEVRIYAEDPKHDFLPSSGVIEFLDEPCPTTSNYQLRVDSGIRQGDTVTSHYDPMLSKLIVWAECREKAITRMSQALMKYRLIGPVTNISYLQQVITQPAFINAELQTHFIEQHQANINAGLTPQFILPLSARSDAPLPIPKLALCAALSAIRQHEPLANWRLNQLPYQEATIHDSQGKQYTFHFHTALESAPATGEETQTRPVELTQITVDHQAYDIKPLACRLISLQENEIASDYLFEISTNCENFSRIDSHQQSHIFHRGWHELFYIDQNYDLEHHTPDEDNQAIAPLNGIVAALFCQPGDQVTKGQPLVVIEAMKMEYTVKAPNDGTITEIPFSIGDQVEHGQQLVCLDKKQGGQ